MPPKTACSARHKYHSALAFAETTFGLLQSEARVGSVVELNRRSAANRKVIDEGWRRIRS